MFYISAQIAAITIHAITNIAIWALWHITFINFGSTSGYFNYNLCNYKDRCRFMAQYISFNDGLGCGTSIWALGKDMGVQIL